MRASGGQRSLVLAPVAGPTAGRQGADGGLVDDVVRGLAPGASALLVLAQDVDLGDVRHVLESSRGRGDVVPRQTVLASGTPEALRVVLERILAALSAALGGGGDPSEPSVPSMRSRPATGPSGGELP
jgi:hypothetical protein